MHFDRVFWMNEKENEKGFYKLFDFEEVSYET